MAEKTLNTRILLKNADLSTWNSSTLVLKAGEVALAKIETTQHDANTGNYYKVPTYLMKVGDGEKTFAQLNWLAAPASDVHTWAKKATLDYADLPATLQTEIDDLQEAVGNGGSVSTQINAAIAALKEACTVADSAKSGEFVTAVSQDDGKIAVTRRALTAADIPTLAISKIDGLQSALDAKATKAEFNTLNNIVTATNTGLVDKLAAETSARQTADGALSDRIDTINTTLGTHASDIATAQSAAEAADAKAAKAQGEVDALDGVVATLTQTVETNKNAASTAVNAEKSAREEADTALGNRITTLANQIGDVANIMNFKGVITTDPSTITTGYSNGDVVIYGNKEYVFDTTDNKFHEFGDTTATSEAITALQGRVTTNEGKIKTLETNSATKTELSTAIGALEDVVDTKETIANVTAVKNRVSALETTVGSASSGLVKEVNALKTTVGGSTSGLVKKVDDLETASATHATKTELNTATSTLQDAIDDEETRAKSEETKLSNSIASNTSEINGVKTRLTTAEGKITTAEGKIAALETASDTHATKANLAAAVERIATIEADYLRVADTYIFDCGGATE